MKRLLFLVFGLCFILLISPVYAQTWWDSDWNYCRDITVSIGTNDLLPTNATHIMKLNSTLIDYTKASSNDIRIINGSCTSAGVEMLQYVTHWNESGDSYVIFQSTEADTTFAMYYGNSNATEKKDFDKIGHYYSDNFTVDTIGSVWYQEVVTGTGQNSTIQSANEGFLQIKAQGGYVVRWKDTITPPFKMISFVKRQVNSSVAGYTQYIGGEINVSTNWNTISNSGWKQAIDTNHYILDDTPATWGITVNTTSFVPDYGSYFMSVVHINNTKKFDAYRSNFILGDSRTYTSTSYMTTPMYPIFTVYGSGSEQNKNFDIDWTILAKGGFEGAYSTGAEQTEAGNDTSPPAISSIELYALNGSKYVLGNETWFNTGNLTDIEFMRINFTVTDETNISSIKLWYNADGSNPCATGNKQHSICYNQDDNTWVEVIFGQDTGTYDDSTVGTARGDSIDCQYIGNDTYREYTCDIDEHYNPNIFKWYEALYAWDVIKWQNLTDQRIRNETMIKIELDPVTIPLDADQYKFDIRVFYNETPTDALNGYLCNSTYVSGDPAFNNNCELVVQKTPSGLTDDGTKFRGIFTKALVDTLGDLKYAILQTNGIGANEYYYIKTYNITNETHTQHWEYSNDFGTTWNNSNDGYETEFNINWFYNTEPTGFQFIIEASENNFTGNSTPRTIFWSIDPSQNYPPIVDIILPASGTTINKNYLVTWITSDPNDDGFITNVSVDNTPIGINLDNTTFQYLLDTTVYIDGNHDITVQSCETGTSELYCSNATHQVTTDNTPPVITVNEPTGNITTSNVTFNITIPEQPSTAVVEVDGSNHTLLPTGNYWIVVVEGLTNGNKTFNAYVSDALGNMGVTQGNFTHSYFPPAPPNSTVTLMLGLIGIVMALVVLLGMIGEELFTIQTLFKLFIVGAIGVILVGVIFTLG